MHFKNFKRPKFRDIYVFWKFKKPTLILEIFVYFKKKIIREIFFYPFPAHYLYLVILSSYYKKPQKKKKNSLYYKKLKRQNRERKKKLIKLWFKKIRKKNILVFALLWNLKVWMIETMIYAAETNHDETSIEASQNHM